jgi:hypothetical protein
MALSIEYWTIYRGPGFLAVIWFNPLPLSRQQVVSLSQSSCVFPVELTKGRGRAWGRGRSQIIRLREGLVFYKSFNSLWIYPSPPPFDGGERGGQFQSVQNSSASFIYNYSKQIISSVKKAPVIYLHSDIFLKTVPTPAKEQRKAEQSHLPETFPNNLRGLRTMEKLKLVGQCKITPFLHGNKL